jgi:hypothetical protein
LFEAGTGLGVLLGLGLGLALGDADGEAEEVVGDGDADADPGSSLPHAPSSTDAKSPRTSTALAGKKRTGKHYPPDAMPRLLEKLPTTCRNGRDPAICRQSR